MDKHLFSFWLRKFCAAFFIKKKGVPIMLRRFLKQLFTSLFVSQTVETKSKEKEIDKQITKLKQMQRTNKFKARPRKKENVL